MTAEVQDLTGQLFDLMARTSDFSLADAKYYFYYLSGQCRNILNYYLKQETPKSSNSIQNVVNYIFFEGTEGLLLPVFYEYHGASEG